jgi:hypothetical protein
MQDEQPSCGKGLATHAALPEKLAALLSAMAGLLENHTRSLPPGGCKCHVGTRGL